MAKVGLLIEYDYCTACHSCEVACQQEHEYPVGQCGIVVTEFVREGRNQPVAIDNLPSPTDFCDLCAHRTAGGELPACVKHCQARCLHYGTISDLARRMEELPKSVLFRPV